MRVCVHRACVCVHCGKTAMIAHLYSPPQKGPVASKIKETEADHSAYRETGRKDLSPPLNPQDMTSLLKRELGFVPNDTTFPI